MATSPASTFLRLRKHYQRMVARSGKVALDLTNVTFVDRAAMEFLRRAKSEKDRTSKTFPPTSRAGSNRKSRDSTNHHREITSAVFPKHAVTVHELLFSPPFPFDRLCNLRFVGLEQLLRICGNHENQITIRLYAQSADVLGDFDHDERAAASRRFSQGQPVGRHRQNQTGRFGAFR